MPCVLKTSRGGYDGKGVWFVESPEESAAAFEAAAATGAGSWPRSGSTSGVSSRALVARSPSGQAAAYPVVESVQRDGICHEVVAPAPGLSDPSSRRAPRSWPCGSRASST